MPKSRKRKKKSTRARRAGNPRPGTTPGYLPGTIPVDDERTFDLLVDMPPHMLPTFGLATWYLASTPQREANQCVLASTVLMMTMRAMHIPAEMVGLTLDIPWAKGGEGVRYGNSQPHMEDDQVVGHVGLIAGDCFLDPTASQFPEIRDNGGVRPIVGSLGGNASGVLNDGAIAQVGLVGGKYVTYHVHALGSADEVAMRLIERERDTLARLTHNLLTGFGVVVASLGEATMTAVRNGPYPGLALVAERSMGKTINVADDGVFQLVDA